MLNLFEARFFIKFSEHIKQEINILSAKKKLDKRDIFGFRCTNTVREDSKLIQNEVFGQ